MHLLLNALVTLPVLAQALKITPIQPNIHKIDLSSESRIATVALTNAMMKIDQGELSMNDPKALLESPEMEKLQSVVSRWNSMEDRLKGVIPPSSTSQLQLFEDIVHNIASIRVLIGHVLFNAGDFDQVVGELEQACPTLWKYKSAWRSFDAHGWFDCYSTLGVIYINKDKAKDAHDIQDRLLRTLPLMRDILFEKDSKQGPSEEHLEASLSYLKAFASLPADYRKHMSAEIKKGWQTMDKIRILARPAVEDFARVGSNRLRLGIVLNLQKEAEDVIERYIVHQPYGAHKESMTYIYKLRNYLIEEIKNETLFYINVMNTIIDNGEDYLSTLRQLYPVPSTHTPFEVLQNAVLASENGVENIEGMLSLEESLGFRPFSSILSEFEHELEQRKVREEAFLMLTKEQEKRAPVKETTSSTGDEVPSAQAQAFKRAKAKRAQAEAKAQQEKAKASSSSTPRAKTTTSSKQSWNSFAMSTVASVVAAVGVAISVGKYIKAQRHQPKLKKTLSNNRRPLSSSGLVTVPKLDLSEETDIHASTVSKQLLYVLQDDLRVCMQEIFIKTIAASKIIATSVFTCTAYLKQLVISSAITQSDLSELNTTNNYSCNLKKLKKKGSTPARLTINTDELSNSTDVQVEALRSAPKRGSDRRKKHQKKTPVSVAAVHEQLVEEENVPTRSTVAFAETSDEQVAIETDETLEYHSDPLANTAILCAPKKDDCESALESSTVDLPLPCGSEDSMAEQHSEDVVLAIRSNSEDSYSESGCDEEKTDAVDATEDNAALHGFIPPATSPSPQPPVDDSLCPATPGFCEGDYLPDDYDLQLLAYLEHEQKEVGKKEEKEGGWIEATSRHQKTHQTNGKGKAEEKRQEMRILKEQLKRKQEESRYSSNNAKLVRNGIPKPKKINNTPASTHPTIPRPDNGKAPSSTQRKLSSGDTKPASSAPSSSSKAPQSGLPILSEQRAVPGQSAVTTTSTNTTIADEGEHSSVDKDEDNAQHMEATSAVSPYYMQAAYYLPPTLAVPPQSPYVSWVLSQQPPPAVTAVLPSPVVLSPAYFSSMPVPHPTPMMPPAMLVRSPSHDIIDLVRKQIEYYFSIENLEKDKYLRAIMNKQGYVELSTIAKFRRIVTFGANADMILDAVYASDLLDVQGVDENATHLSPDEELLLTRVRTIYQPLSWLSPSSQ